MRLSKKGVDVLIEEEGFRTRAYTDQEGAWTIGVGHLLTRTELNTKKILIGKELVAWGPGLTKAQVIALMEQDLREVEEALDYYVKVPLEQHQFDALVLFLYNIGDDQFKKSTLLRLLNEGNYEEVPAQLVRWDKVTINGIKKVSNGLVDRRQKEIALWNNTEPVA